MGVRALETILGLFRGVFGCGLVVVGCVYGSVLCFGLVLFVGEILVWNFW